MYDPETPFNIDISAFDKWKKDPILEELRNIGLKRSWKTKIQEYANSQNINDLFKDRFHTYWVECGATIREQVADDQYLVSVLRKLIPSYKGSGITLYRGENLNRWQSRHIGLCWTTSIETAVKFAQGLNAVNDGGILLRCHASKEAVIASPNAHSKYLGEEEYTVDPKQLSDIEVLEKYETNPLLRY